ncbi:uncharacterized protein LOC131850980 [Achroia grisella]|uniref:uncharacterized protein LOC131842000 n=1 Tax=Achroia grisella TaxID=688607 RepID=UPI0027D26BE3|nr:uncharacterized protein LOC131842000 [Achroia grisella]XP_059046956.1 uncharacterized protein LOC131842441 [Achroia grisella]XP_059057382.1 uncharacterized protein LOC131850980 [Achroia grisella]
MYNQKLSLQDTRAEFAQRMEEFEKRLQKASSSNSDTTAIAEDFATFKEFTLKSLAALQHQVDLLVLEVDRQEMRSRKRILLIHGVPEARQEDTASVVEGVVVDQLKVIDFTAANISRCHRMGRLNSAKSRPILVKMCDTGIRDKIWFAKTNLKGSSITVSEFLTKLRHDTFMMARQRFGVKKCWSRDGFIHILCPDGSKHRVSSLAELEKVAPPRPVPEQQKIAPQVKDNVAASKTRRANVKK